MLRKTITIITTLALLVLATLPIMAQATTTNTTMVFTIGSTTYSVNGQTRQMDAAPRIVPPGRTIVPVRFLAQALGTQVQWDGVTKTVILTKGTTNEAMAIGSEKLMVDGEGQKMDTAPVIVPPGRTMLPARFVAQVFGYGVNWDATAQTVTIKSNDGFSIPAGTALQVQGATPDQFNPNAQGVSLIVDSSKGSLTSQLADVKTILSQAPYLDPTTINNMMDMLDQDAKGKYPQYMGVFNSSNGGGILANSNILNNGRIWMVIDASNQPYKPLPSTDEGIWPGSFKG